MPKFLRGALVAVPLTFGGAAAYAADIVETAVSAGSSPTVQGSPVAIDATGDGVMVDDANVVQADIEADNGVIHVIDAVIMPAM